MRVAEPVLFKAAGLIVPDPSMMPPPMPPPFNDVDTGCDAEYITAAMKGRDLGRAEPRVVRRKAGRRSGGEYYEL